MGDLTSSLTAHCQRQAVCFEYGAGGGTARDTRYKPERRDLQVRNKGRGTAEEGINANLTQSIRLNGSHRRHMFVCCPLTF